MTNGRRITTKAPREKKNEKRKTRTWCLGGEYCVASENAAILTMLNQRKLSRSFYAREAEVVAHDLVGTILVRRERDGTERRARIVETEAYVGPHDLACHAAKGRTARTEVMFGEAGHAYVYFIYGMYDMLNIVTGAVGDAQAVLVRAAEPMDGWEADLSGPGKLTRAFGITRGRDNRLDLTGDRMFLERATGKLPRVIRSKRIGVDYARDWAHAMLRFVDADSAAVSKPWPEELRRKNGAAIKRKSGDVVRARRRRKKLIELSDRG